MEKKKKLQLKKETVAVLNGQNMNKVVGGVGVVDCQNQAQCPEGYVCAEKDNVYVCVQEDSLLSVVATVTVVTIVATTVTVDYPTQKTNTCLTCKPGQQNTCGMCTP